MIQVSVQLLHSGLDGSGALLFEPGRQQCLNFVNLLGKVSWRNLGHRQWGFRKVKWAHKRPKFWRNKEEPKP